MRPQLPLEVLGLMGPILSWVEGGEELRLPKQWIGGGLAPAARERAWLIRELPTYSYDTVDEVVRMARRGRAAPSRPRAWTSSRPRWRLEPPEDYFLPDVFRRLAKRYFRWSGSDLRVRAGLMEEVHELSLRFPVGHLVRHAHARAVAAGFLRAERALDLPEQLSALHTTSRGLKTVVDRGVSEGHLHFWGVTSADEAWADHLLQELGTGIFERFSPAELRLLTLSRYGARLLALGLLHVRLGLAVEPQLLFSLLERLDRLYLCRLGSIEEWPAQQELRRDFQHALKRVLWYAEAAHSDPEIEWILRLLSRAAQRLWRRRSALPKLPVEGVRERVFLVERLHFEVQWTLLTLGPRLREDPRTGTAQQPGRGARPREVEEVVWSHETRGEGRLLWDFLHQALFRYLIFQTQHWQLATQSGRTTGLRQFRRFYGASQRTPFNRKGIGVQGLIVDRLRRSSSLRTVEGRLSPPRRGHRDLVPWVLGYARAAQNEQLERFGLVIHFIKDAQPTGSSRRHGFDRFTVRNGRARRRTRRAAFQLFRLLAEPHPVVPFLVGIDAANLELTTPPEVFAPAFRFLREYPIELQRASARTDRYGTQAAVRSLVEDRRLGMTYHVGEDFRHLLSGLRAVAETMQFLRPAPGDRLGHALVLGLDPGVWAGQTGFQAVVSTQEWLDTLVWVHHFLGPGHDVLGELQVEDSIQRLSWEIYGVSARQAGRSDRSWSPLTLFDAWRLRQLDPYSIDLGCLERGECRLRPLQRFGPERWRWAYIQTRVLGECQRHVGSSAAYRLLGWYWYDEQARRRGERVITVDMQERAELWLDLCREVQEKMVRKVEERQLVIEVNPSSNRLIGPMPSYEDHPIFHLTLDEESHLARRVRVTVNTDDPGVFNTSLAHEYYLLGEIQLRRGVPEAEVVNWLDWLRRNGNDYTFVRILPEARDPRVKEVLRALQRQRRSLQRRMEGDGPWPEFWGWFRGDELPSGREGEGVVAPPPPGSRPSAEGAR